jgi:RNA polymerase sigma-70 factor (ECF subfamily)
VFAYAHRRGADAEAPDVVAETFLVAWRRFEDVPGDPLPWLLNVARKVIANRRLSDSRRGAIESKVRSLTTGPAASGDPADEVAGRFAVLAALEKLSEKEREAVAIWAWEGLDGRRAATALGCSVTAFALRLHRARRRLVKELAASGHLSGENEGTSEPDVEEANRA